MRVFEKTDHPAKSSGGVLLVTGRLEIGSGTDLDGESADCAGRTQYRGAQGIEAPGAVVGCVRSIRPTMAASPAQRDPPQCLRHAVPSVAPVTMTAPKGRPSRNAEAIRWVANGIWIAPHLNANGGDRWRPVAPCPHESTGA